MPFLQKITIFCSRNAGSENSGDFGQNLVFSDSAIEAILFL